MTVTVKRCSCTHKGQDKIYGEGRRLANQTSKSAGSHPIYRCTVCNKEFA